LINRNISPTQTKGIYSGPNPSFGNYLSGTIGTNTRNNYPGLVSTDDNGKDAWLNFPARVSTQAATANPMFLQTGSNLSAVNFAAQQLAKDAGVEPNVATGATVGGFYY
jgi:hypothetical protein